ncbi:PDZ domain-containing protein [Pseudobacteriovorax antillogorgiicola]|uniref:PDZ domain-containing protein n=1 Tax=Pseudobacteriovorax antillogorgiicola TaxID=1513793 RepID=A0A1Y6CKS8_9BACT|nr:PDZ domain-containing protein [Pseudobacteriovorax antillogorgiicola]TCS46167.1 PDZ domain-containing protein [Pseudobacteriovorax antillogorgiicola]SMF69946.1 PDZ domain-containing protein [Pseudobacteriovorax antillogorgiicola]
MLKRLCKTILVTLLFSFTPLAQASDLGYIVLGVIASSENQKGVALLKHKSSGKVSAFREGDPIREKLSISRVYRKTVEFVWNQQIYSMSVGDDSPRRTPDVSSPVTSVAANLTHIEGVEKNGNTLTVNRSLKESLVGENLNKVLMQAAAVPHTRNGRLIGFKLLEIDAGSIYDVAGFKDGDIITHINELPINDAGRAIKALSSLRQASTANFSYLRQNQEHELIIRIN